MASSTERERATTPDDLFRLFVERVNSGDLDGIMELYEDDGTVAYIPEQPATGAAEIRQLFEQLLMSKPRYSVEWQQPTITCGRLALTSARFPSGEVTAEVACRQADGSWVWVIDQPNILA